MSGFSRFTHMGCLSACTLIVSISLQQNGGFMALPSDLGGASLYRFIGGRRRYNARRRARAVDRRYRLLFTWAKNPYMTKADLARLMGVHRSTITRDIQALKEDWGKTRTCPFCGGHLPSRNLPEEMEWLSGAVHILPPLP
jgi:hypothetical protein